MITGKTRLIGLLGDPVNHSLSPSMHNAALKKMGLDWCYLALPCKKNALSQVLDGLYFSGCKGLNITIPHKSNVAKLCKELTPLAKKLGAVNTVLPNPAGGWTGDNTDMEGFLDPLKKIKLNTNGNATIVGCGGSARAVIAGLEELNFKEITIIGRNKNSLEKFLIDTKGMDTGNSSQLNVKILLDSDPNVINFIRKSTLIVNTTPIGMNKADEDEKIRKSMPISEKVWNHLTPDTILYDLIYTPRPTAWLQNGKLMNCRTIDGLEMLISQGAASLRLWSGIQEIPINLMREAAEIQLKR